METENISKDARKILGLKQAELAEELGLTSRHLSRMENGHLLMPVTTMLAIECLLRRKKDKRSRRSKRNENRKSA